MAKKKSDFIDISALLHQYLSKWYIFVISIVGCLVLGFLFTKVKVPIYGVRANVLINVDSTNPLSNFEGIGDLFGSNGIVDDEVFVISSHSLYRDVIKEMGINQSHMVKRGFLSSKHAWPDMPLWIETAPGVADTLRTTINFVVKVGEDGKADIKVKARKKTLANLKNVTLPATVSTPYGDYTITPTKYFLKNTKFTDKINISGYHAAAENLAQEIVANVASKKSNAIVLEFNTPNSDYGEAVLNSIIAHYNQRGINERNLQGEKTAEFIDGRLRDITHELAQAETDIQRYKEQHGLTDVEADVRYNTERRTEVESQLLAAETQAEIVKMTREFLTNPNNAYALVPAPLENNSGLQKAIENYNTLIITRMEMAGTVHPGNLALKQIDEQLDAMRSNILTSIDKAYQSSMITIRDLKAEKSKSDVSVNSYPVQEREFIELERRQSMLQTLYIFLLQRNEETAMLLANATPKGVIVDEAYTLNKPIGLSKKLVMLMALIMGLVLAPAYLYLKKILRNKFDTREEAERELDPPVLGEMCLTHSNENLVISSSSTTSEAELFRLLRTNLQFILNDDNDKVVLITSSRSGEGKSFVSVNLAASLALLENKRVLLIGMDIRKPQLANYLNLPPNPGITQYLTNSNIKLPEIIHTIPGYKCFDVIVSGPIPPNPGEILASDKVDKLFETLRQQYDFIIIDSAPVGMVSDTFTLNRVSDATVFITRINHTLMSDINFINTIYEQKRLNKLSVVINGTTSRKGYGYGYGHQQSSGKK